MTKYLMQHWHFYQPRENEPWTTKINKECYVPNSKSGILDNISFNLGPTLIDWMFENDNETLKRFIESNKGQALAQSYNHRILPLAKHDEDIKTQIVWGKKHFKKYFKQDPKGIWLPESATSTRVLEECAKQDIKFTIGAPWQQTEPQNNTEAYKIELPSGNSINYFFYNNASSLIAFNQLGLLKNSDKAVEHLSRMINDGETMLLAYDAETFGHHHKFADLWAEHFPESVDKFPNVKTITLNEYMDKFNVTKTSNIVENSAWSCFHDLDRWSKGCDCVSDSNKAYQEPLLKTLENLENKVHETYFDIASKYLKNPWDARNDYIDVVLDNIDFNTYFNKHGKSKLSTEIQTQLKGLLEAEYSTQLSFTSCGWFFSKLSIQTLKNMDDAYHASEKLKESSGKDVTKELLEGFKKMEDWNNGLHVNGKDVFENENIQKEWVENLYK